MRFGLLLLLIAYGCTAPGCVMCWEEWSISSEIRDRNVTSSSPIYEFTHAGSKPVKLEAGPPRLNHAKAYPFSGWMEIDEDSKLPEVWIAPFAGEHDALLFDFVAPPQKEVSRIAEIIDIKCANVQYFPNKKFDDTARLKPVKLIFVDQPQMRDENYSSYILGKNEYDYVISPGGSDYRRDIRIDYLTDEIVFDHRKMGYATILNPADFPRLNRNRHAFSLNDLNYIWAVPLDLIVVPVGTVVGFTLYGAYLTGLI